MSEREDPIRVTVWNEGWHERHEDHVAQRYPEGIHGAIAEGLQEQLGAQVAVRTATFYDGPDHGLTDEVLDETDVLMWWGHKLHPDVNDEVVARVVHRVHAGMGLVVLHSGHWSKVFIQLMGTTCTLRWRAADDRELVWTVDPTHPIAQGVPHPIIIDEQEMYGEFFDIPTPDELVFLSTFSGGEVFRSGCAFHRGRGRIFYFSPGDQHYPVYHHPGIRRVLANSVRWARPTAPRELPTLARFERGWFEEASDA